MCAIEDSGQVADCGWRASTEEIKILQPGAQHPSIDGRQMADTPIQNPSTARSFQKLVAVAEASPQHSIFILKPMRLEPSKH